MKKQPKAKQRIDDLVKALQTENEKLKRTLILIHNGLKKGNIKSQPIMTIIPDAKEWPLQTLEEIISDVLK